MISYNTIISIYFYLYCMHTQYLIYNAHYVALYRVNMYVLYRLREYSPLDIYMQTNCT